MATSTKWSLVLLSYPIPPPTWPSHCLMLLLTLVMTFPLLCDGIQQSSRCHPRGPFLFLKVYYYLMCMSVFPCLSLCAPCVWHAHGVLKRCGIPWKQNYRRLWATVQVQETKPRFSIKAVSTLNYWDISPATALKFPLYGGF